MCDCAKIVTAYITDKPELRSSIKVGTRFEQFQICVFYLGLDFNAP